MTASQWDQIVCTITSIINLRTLIAGLFILLTSLVSDSNANHILLDITMFNTLFNTVPLFDGAMIFQKWKLHMMAYIMSIRDSYILQKDRLAKNFMNQDICKVVEDWDIANMKIAGNIFYVYLMQSASKYQNLEPPRRCGSCSGLSMASLMLQ